MGNKYQFSKHLTVVGDFVQTEPMTVKESWNIMYAAQMWAWDHMRRVSVDRYPVDGGNKRVVRITLVSRDRERDYR